jgi:hypothetical protein
VSFENVKIGYVGESFRFSNVSYFHERVFTATIDTRHLAQEEE